mgnify:CR=1 FL=1
MNFFSNKLWNLDFIILLKIIIYIKSSVFKTLFVLYVEFFKKLNKLLLFTNYRLRRYFFIELNIKK